MSIKNNFPALKPTLNLDFASTKRLDPRVTFSRASTASYYDGKTVAKAEENLLTWSQDFDNAVWGKASVTVVANADIAPDGTLTADYLSPTSADSNIQRDFTPAGALPYVFTVWLKSATGANVSTQLVCNRTSPYSVVQTQAITVTTSWQRFTLSFSALDASLHNLAVGRASTLETGENLLIWGAQLEQRSSATAYTPTTSAPITNYLPALQYAAAGVPRFDHDPITGESKGLLIEESRTNLLSYSSDFDNVSWTKQASSIMANCAVAVDGSVTADKLIADTSNAQHYTVCTSSVSVGATYTLSVYAKAGGSNWISLQACLGNQVWFNLATGTVGSTTQTGVTGSISNAGNGWYRCSVTISAAVGSAHYIFVRPGDGQYSYTGDGYSGVYIWGAQLEQGAFATSYIPTTTAQVTRAADSASMTGTNFSSWFRQDEGTVYAESSSNGMNALSLTSTVFAIHDGTVFNRIRFAHASNTRFNVAVNGTDVVSLVTAYTNGTAIKQAGAYKSDDFSYSVSGAAVQTDTSGGLPVANQMQIGGLLTGRENNGCIKKIAYYPKRLSNTELQNLTI